MHYVSKIDFAQAMPPRVFGDHRKGFRRDTYVDRAMGARFAHAKA